MEFYQVMKWQPNQEDLNNYTIQLQRLINFADSYLETNKEQRYISRFKLQKQILKTIPSYSLEYLSTVRPQFRDLINDVYFMFQEQKVFIQLNYLISKCQTETQIFNLCNNLRNNLPGEFEEQIIDIFDLEITESVLLNTSPNNFEKIIKIYNLLRDYNYIEYIDQEKILVKEKKRKSICKPFMILREDDEYTCEDRYDFFIENILNLNIQNKTDEEMKHLEETINFILKQEIQPLESKDLKALFSIPTNKLEEFFNIINPIRENLLLHSVEITNLLKIYLDTYQTDGMKQVQLELNKNLLYKNLKNQENLSELINYTHYLYKKIYKSMARMDLKDDDEKDYLIIVEQADLMSIIWYTLDPYKTIKQNIDFYKENKLFLNETIINLMLDFINSIKDRSEQLPYSFYNALKDRDMTSEYQQPFNKEKIDKYFFLYLFKKANQYNCNLDSVYLNAFQQIIPDGDERDAFSYLVSANVLEVYGEMHNKDLYNIFNYSSNFINWYTSSFSHYKQFDKRRSSIIKISDLIDDRPYYLKTEEISNEAFMDIYGNKNTFQNKHNYKLLSELEQQYRLNDKFIENMSLYFANSIQKQTLLLFEDLNDIIQKQRQENKELINSFKTEFLNVLK